MVTVVVTRGGDCACCGGGDGGGGGGGVGGVGGGGLAEMFCRTVEKPETAIIEPSTLNPAPRLLTV